MSRPLALVVGGSGAIGAAVVDRLFKRGHTVLATCRGGEQPAGEAAVTWVRFDATEPDSATRIAEALDTEHDPLRTIIYAAGAGSTKRTVGDTPLSEFNLLWQVNAAGLVAVWQAVARSARAGAARVVAVSSETVRSAGAGNGPYTASKAALEAIATTLAKEEAAHGVRVNVVSPSLVASPMAETLLRHKDVPDPAAYYATLPWGRALETAEVADLVVEVATGEHWRYATGQVFRLAAATGTG